MASGFRKSQLLQKKLLKKNFESKKTFILNSSKFEVMIIRYFKNHKFVLYDDATTVLEIAKKKKFLIKRKFIAEKILHFNVKFFS